MPDDSNRVASALDDPGSVQPDATDWLPRVPSMVSSSKDFSDSSLLFRAVERSPRVEAATYRDTGS